MALFAFAFDSLVIASFVLMFSMGECGDCGDFKGEVAAVSQPLSYDGENTWYDGEVAVYSVTIASLSFGGRNDMFVWFLIKNGFEKAT